MNNNLDQTLAAIDDNSHGKIEQRRAAIIDAAMTEAPKPKVEKLYTALAHEKPIPLNRRKVGGPTKYYAMQLIKGDFHDGGKPLPHVPTKPGRSKYIPHVGKKQSKKKLQCAR